jgi:hypothetical protein
MRVMSKHRAETSGEFESDQAAPLGREASGGRPAPLPDWS